jgi:hypothetical protein
MRSTHQIFTCLTFAFFATTIQAQNSDSRWQLQVEDLNHRVKLNATIRLTQAKDTGACIGGEWKRVVVENSSGDDLKFFPISDVLSFDVKGNALVLGRTQICDAYLLLHGKKSNKTFRGTYESFGLGHKEKLGYFSMKPIR